MSKLRLSTICSLPLFALSALACNGGPVVASSGSEAGSDTATGTTMAATSTTNATATTSSSATGTASETGTSTTNATATDSSSTTSPGSATDTMTGTTDPTDATTTDATTTDGTTGTTTDGTTGTTTDGTTGTTDATTGTTGTTGVMEDPCPCAEVEVPLDNGIFVLSDNAQLWKYLPEDNSFQNLGAIGCDGMDSTFSMAVDRAGFAWVMFDPPTGDIWKVDVTDPTNCTDPGYNEGQMGIKRFGMAFVSEDQFNTCDQLYGNTYNGIGGFGEGQDVGTFLTVDPDTLLVETLGKTSFNGSELTGTGDGRVFMFGGVNPAKLVEVNKQNGEYLDTIPLGNLDLTNAFAFAFFAGDFYFFTESAGPGSNSKVTHFDYDDSDNNGIQDLTVLNNNAPIRIVGAGVSTCAPFLPQ